MKLREYFNSVNNVRGKTEHKMTRGYPCKLPGFPTQFALVRPADELFDYARKGWQVIHIKTGMRIGSSWNTKADAIRYAIAELEWQTSRIGKKKVMEIVGKSELYT